MIFLAGLVIYAGYGMPGLAFLLAATSASYLMGLLISRHRWLVWVSIALNAGLLLAIKLRPITGWELLAPMGASYFLLRVISITWTFIGESTHRSNPSCATVCMLPTCPIFSWVPLSAVTVS